MISSASDVADKDYRHKARRPAITPLFACGCALWAATALVYAYARCLDASDLRAAFLPLLVCAICFMGLSIALKRIRLMGFLITCATLGSCLAIAQAVSLHESSDQISNLDTTQVLLKAENDSSSGMFSETVDATLELSSGRKLFVQAQFKTGLTLYYGQIYEVSGKLKGIDYRSAEFDWQRGYAATFKVNNAHEVPDRGIIGFLSNFRIKAIESLEAQNEEQAVVQALSCGYRRAIKDTETYSNYQSCGLAHLIAVSGAHLVIVTSLTAALLKLMRLPRKVSIGILVSCMTSYVVLAAAPISALRALLMSSVGILSLLGKRTPSSQNALGLSIFAILLYSPAEAVSASFALSALSTAGIVLFAPLIGSWLQRIPVIGSKWMRDALALTIAASLFSQPISCALFGMLPLASPLANITTTPLFAPLCGISLIAALAGGLGIPFASLFRAIASFAAGIINSIVSLIASLPFASVPFTCGIVEGIAASAFLALLLWTTWPKKLVGLCVLAETTVLFACFLIIDLPGDRIVMLDVGQGDAILLKSQGQSVLIDTGNNDSQLLSELAKQHITTLDALAITHADDDHCGALDALNRAVNVKAGLIPQDMLSCSEEKVSQVASEIDTTVQNIIPLKAKDTFHLGAFKLTVVWPHAFEEEGGNADSLCLWVEYDGNEDGRVDFTALFTGDAEAKQIQTMLDEHAIKNVDILKVGHHGSKNALTQREAYALSPSIALIGVGANNRYGHPAEATLECLDETGAKIFRTDLNGTITCKLDSKALTVSCAR